MPRSTSGLNIIEKRDDGFHSIETVFCPVGLSDVLEFIPEPAFPPGTCIFDSTGIPIDGPDEKNLCVRAYRLLCGPIQPVRPCISTCTR